MITLHVDRLPDGQLCCVVTHEAMIWSETIHKPVEGQTYVRWTINPYLELRLRYLDGQPVVEVHQHMAEAAIVKPTPSPWCWVPRPAPQPDK